MSGRFVFDRDFSRPAGTPSPKAEAALAEAEARGHARGVAEGRAAALAEVDAAKRETLARIAEASRALLADADARGNALEAEALAFAETLARTLAGAALERFPLDTIMEAAREAFGHLRGVPHLVVRVEESLVDEVEALVKTLARERGFEGRLVVIGENDIARGDARFEWADGGVVRDGAALAAEIARKTTGATHETPGA
ncbi:flagellar assembly protein FliH [Salinarimonas ramus]|uniref:Flagellar assembly protein FliH n=1 Tax=Salinarimonas ramus TaxID=690164 RepID=A0A917QIS3_9HYPH|nr:flagellar assembly protein FliH [Salinarimonas ramus]GGK52373.1 flagellar assembly protein FliH [Salinarimonas ramus]